MDFYYILYYLLLFSIIGELFSKKVKNVIMIGWCIFFTLIGGLRWQIGGDWDQYYDHFLFSRWSNIFNYDRYGNGRETMEPGFVFLNVLIKTIFKTFYAYNLVECAFIQFTYYKFSKYFCPKKPLFAYIFLMIMANNAFPVRAGYSVAISFWCWKFIKEQNLIKYLSVVFCAFLIHNQAIVLIPCYFLGYLKLRSRHYMIIYPIIALFAFRFQDYFAELALLFGGSIAEKAQLYTEIQTAGFSDTANYMGWALNYGFLLVYLLIRKLDNLYDSYFYNVLLNAFMIYNAIFMIFAAGMGDLARTASLYFPAQCILFTIAFQFFLKFQGGKFKILVVFFLLSYLVYRVPAIWSGYFFKQTSVPYKTIFNFNV